MRLKWIVLATIIFSMLGSNVCLAANADWYLYVWSDASNSGEDFGPFQTTSSSNVFLLEGLTITETGLKFCVHNSDWSSMYGWSQGNEGVVSGISETIALGATTSASGWLAIPAYIYDVTFNTSEPSICFTTHTDTGQKRVSILGDSYSTFYGWMTPSTNICYYSNETNLWHEGQDLTQVEQTWWHQVISSNGDYVFERNNSYSGSTMVNTPLEGMDVSTSFINRADNLGNPDVILICGGTNDNWNTAMTMGDYKYSDWTEDDKKQFCPGFSYLLYHLKTLYPQAEVYFVLNDILDNVSAPIRSICTHYGVPVIEPHGIDKCTDGHPTIAGMKTIADAVKNQAYSSFCRVFLSGR